MAVGSVTIAFKGVLTELRAAVAEAKAEIAAFSSQAAAQVSALRAEMASLGKQTAMMGQSWTGLNARFLTTLGLFGLVTGFITQGVVSVSKYDEALRHLSTTLEAQGQSWADNKAQVEKFIDSVSEASSFTRTEVAESMAFFASKGNDVAMSERLVSDAIKINVATGIELTRVMFGLNLAAKDHGQYLGRILGLQSAVTDKWLNGEQALREVERRYDSLTPKTQDLATETKKLKKDEADLADTIGKALVPVLQSAVHWMDQFLSHTLPEGAAKAMDTAHMAEIEAAIQQRQKLIQAFEHPRDLDDWIVKWRTSAEEIARTKLELRGLLLEREEFARAAKDERDTAKEKDPSRPQEQVRGYTELQEVLKTVNLEYRAGLATYDKVVVAYKNLIAASAKSADSAAHLQAIIGLSSFEAKHFEERLKDIEQAYKSGLVSEQEYRTELTDLIKEFPELAGPERVKALDDIARAMDNLKAKTEEFSKAMSKGLSEVIEGTKSVARAFGDMLKDILGHLASNVAKKIADGLTQMLSPQAGLTPKTAGAGLGPGVAGPGVLGDVGSWLSNLFSGQVPGFQGGGVFRAAGGGAGLAVLHDRERVVPAGGGGGDMHVHNAPSVSLVVNAVDSKSFEDRLMAHSGAITNAVYAAMSRNNHELRRMMAG